MMLFRIIMLLAEANKTEKQRTLWRTHLVVCRRCKAKAESLRQTDGDACMKALCFAAAVLSGLLFYLEKHRKKEITHVRQTP